MSDAQYTFTVLYFKLIFLTGLLENYLPFIYDCLVHFRVIFVPNLPSEKSLSNLVSRDFSLVNKMAYRVLSFIFQTESVDSFLSSSEVSVHNEPILLIYGNKSTICV